MNKETIANNVKQKRIRKGLSQEALAEKAGLNLRTLQRIEKGENIPRGDTLQRLAKVLDTSPDELIDWVKTENKNALTMLNLSMLSFLFFPLLGILIPLALWISQKDKIQGVNNLGKSIINLQITLNIITFSGYIIGILSTLFKLYHFVNTSAITAGFSIYFISSFICSLYCIVITIINASKISKNKNVWYKPTIAFFQTSK